MPNFIKFKKPADRFVRIAGMKRATTAPARPETPPAPAPKVIEHELTGKAVFFDHDGVRMGGKLLSVTGEKGRVRIAIPGRDGLLYLSDDADLTVDVSALSSSKAVLSSKRVCGFEMGVALKLSEDSKAFAVHAVAGDTKSPVVDYLDVVIEGYASTWDGPEELDRGGDYVHEGAFSKSLLDFSRNPVAMLNHTNTVEQLAGSWTKISQDKSGLAVQGKISNAPGLRDLRFKLVEGHLKGLSIGGRWHYGDDGRGIEEAELVEISIVAVPMNAKTLAYTKSLTAADCRKAWANTKQFPVLSEAKP